MSGNDELSSDEERNFGYNDEYWCYYWEESPKEVKTTSRQDFLIFKAVLRKDVAAVQQALQAGSNVNAVIFTFDSTPLLEASGLGYDHIVRILLQAGADAWWRNDDGESAILMACSRRRLSTVQLLIHHDNGLLEIVDNEGRTPLFGAIIRQHSDMVRFLLDSGANAQHVDNKGLTTLMHACQRGSLEIVRLLLAAGIDVDAPDNAKKTALHHAAFFGEIEVVRELVFQHNANMFAVNCDGLTPFALACVSWETNAAAHPLLEMYGNKLTHDHS